MKLDHHRTIHLCPIHIINTIHSHQVVVLGSYVHHVLIGIILILSLTII